MAWSLKSGPIADKVSALLVYDTSINEPVLMMDDGNIKTVSGGGLEEQPVGDEPTYPACTSGQWGFAEGGNNIATRTVAAFNPSYLRAVDGVQGGLPPIDVRDDADTFQATSWMILYNNVIALGGGLELLWGNDATDGLGIAIDNSNQFAVARHTGPVTSQSTTVYPTGTPFAIAATGRRRNDASTDDQLFYATRAGGTMASISGPDSNTGTGNDKFFRDWGRRQTGVSMDADTYMFIIFNKEKLSLSEFQTIFDDPLGTLIDTGVVSGPVITANATTAIATTSATGNVGTDTVEGTMWGGVWAAAATPSIADIKAGTGAVAGTASSQAVTGASLTFPVTGLTNNTDYKFHYVQEDASTNNSNQAEDAFTTLTSTTPVLTSPQATSITTNSCVPQVTTNVGSGTLFYIVQPSAVAAPSAGQIKAGQDGTGSAALANANQAVSNTGLQTMASASGLSPSTEYELFFTQENLSAAADATPVFDTFTTLALAKTVSVQLADINGVNRANLATVPWAWYDAVPATGVSPTDTGSGSSDANGNISVTLTGTTLTNGQTGYLVIRESTGPYQSIHVGTVVES